MPYTPPVGTADLHLAGTYTPPVGTADLQVGYDPDSVRSLAIAGVTAAPTGAIVIAQSEPVIITGVTAAPTGSIQIRRIIVGTIAGVTAAPSGRLDIAYDPNLLSAVHVLRSAVWQPGEILPQTLRESLQGAPDIRVGPSSPWREAALLNDAERPGWRDSPALFGPGSGAWREAAGLTEDFHAGWRQAPRIEARAPTRWQEADPATIATSSRFRVRLPLLAPDAGPSWQHGATISYHVRDGMQDGRLTIAVDIEVWQQAGYPGNAPNPGPDIPPIFRPPWGTTLRIACPLPGTALRIGRVPCILIPETDIPVRRSYMVTNSASLVRWPDLTPLPVISLSVETDFESWCWGLSATLAGPDAWALVQPNPLACEVQATINGQVWRFLLDVPSTNRSFNSDRVTLKGRSRSAWLHDPYTPARDLSQTEAREMQQLGEAALENTGWTLDWQTPNWLVPAYRYTRWDTPIGALIKLMQATGDGLYTDPYLQIITTLPRWPAPAWLLDGETVDLAVPESAVISLSQSPVYKPPYNGVYVSGTTHGALALVKITGTDGALQPAEPITDELLCDAAGVAARQRGLNVLSDSGAGFEMDAELLFAPAATPAFPLVPPGRIVRVAGLKGVSRSCRISAAWSGDGLRVRQSVGLERREVEA
ncbi:MAG: hypothetical protein NHG36_20105 [Chromatiaceae bacterium]|nr:hypothetical protein [Candidatus Thioaporhodococcus sediminis]